MKFVCAGAKVSSYSHTGYRSNHLTMRITSFLIICLFMSTSLAAQWGRQIKGNGNIETENRDVRPFTEIKSCCSMEVFVTKGNDHSARVEADENILEYVVLESRGDRLLVRTRDKVNLRPSQRIRVYLTTKEITGLYASSSSDLIVKSPFSGDELEIDCSSSADLEVDFTGREVDVESSSSSSIILKGKVDRAKFDSSSSSRIDGRNFTAGRVDAQASSSSRISVNVNQSLDADVSSSGRIEYRGNPDKINTDTSSGGKVRKID